MSVKAFAAIFVLRLKNAVQFRGAYGLGLAAGVITGFVRVCVVWVFYAYGTGQAGMTAAQAVSYIWLTSAAWGLQNTFNMSLWSKITKGDVALDLLRPADIYAHWLADTLAARLAPLVSQAAPLLAAAALISFVPGGFGLSGPGTPAGAALCALTLVTGMLLGGTVGNLNAAMIMEPRVGDVPSRILGLFILFLSGTIVPLNLLPDWAQTFLRFQPFAGLYDLPFRLYVGTLSPADAPGVILTQLAWTGALFALGRAWMNRGLKRVVIQGG